MAVDWKTTIYFHIPVFIFGPILLLAVSLPANNLVTSELYATYIMAVFSLVLRYYNLRKEIISFIDGQMHAFQSEQLTELFNTHHEGIFIADKGIAAKDGVLENIKPMLIN